MGASSNDLSPRLSRELKTRAGWGVFLGVLIAGLGVLLIAYPLATATITTFLFGCILVAVGVIDIVLAIGSHTSGRLFLRVLLGIVLGLAGVLLIASPLAGVAVLTLWLGVMLISEAVVSAVLAFHMRPVAGWGWLLFDAGVSLVLGGLILAHWPVSSIWAIGTLVGAAVLMRGITRIALSAGLRRAAVTVEHDDIPRPRAA
jgi:uncharacterized membrane protein HdeD (DUF308 family)